MRTIHKSADSGRSHIGLKASVSLTLLHGFGKPFQEDRSPILGLRTTIVYNTSYSDWMVIETRAQRKHLLSSEVDLENIPGKPYNQAKSPASSISELCGDSKHADMDPRFRVQN